MRITIVSLGKIRQAYVKAAEAEYLPRLAGKAKVGLEELDVGKFAQLPPDELKRREGELFLSRYGNAKPLIALDERGTQLSSKAFAAWIGDQQQRGRSEFTFAIGGALGWDEVVRTKAHLVWSLSSLTFPHQLARVLVTEQLYRALSILSGEPYHKD